MVWSLFSCSVKLNMNYNYNFIHMSNMRDGVGGRLGRYEFKKIFMKKIFRVLLSPLPSLGVVLLSLFVLWAGAAPRPQKAAP